MIKRTVTAIVALLLFVPILIFGSNWVTTGVFALICGFSVYEMSECCKLSKKWLVSIPAILVAMGCVFIPLVLGKRIFGAATALLVIIPVALIYFLFYGVFFHKKTDIERLLMFFALVIYITAGFTALATLRYVFGNWTVAFVLTVSWGTDTFAYFSGMLFGKKKLCPEISPKKTIAGAIGGTLFGTLLGVLVFYLAGRDLIYAVYALPLSIVSQLGDLAASVIKRRFDVKDYGKIFPGHGGVLDRFDSIIPVSIMTAVVFMGHWVLVWII